MRYTWALQITYRDDENNEFLTLGGAAWRTKRERDANLRRIPTARVDHGFILDIESTRGIEDDRLIDASTVEKLLGEPIADLIAKARAALSAESAALQAPARSMTHEQATNLGRSNTKTPLSGGSR